ncbi:MAG TPA: DUF1761 domain-containing protein [Nitrospirota bacterium]|nr:DUF1761 domain-containing protein [Nitrospirota bacterium]
MKPVPINYLAVVAAAIASMVIGFVWYGPLFGKTWMKLSGTTPVKMDTAKAPGMGKTYVLAFVGSLVMSYVLAHSLVFAAAYYGMGGVSAGLMSGFWNWLGFIAPVTLAAVLWESKPWKLWVLTNGYYLVTLLVMGTILSAWK